MWHENVCDFNKKSKKFVIFLLFTYLYYNVNQLLDLNYKDALFVYFQAVATPDWGCTK